MKISSLKNKVTGVLVVSAALGCGGADSEPEVPEQPYINGPFVDLTAPSQPGAILSETANAAGGVLTCIQGPPSLDINTMDAINSCLTHADLPVNVACDGYKGTGICHNPQIHSTGIVPCTSVTGVTCLGGVSAYIQHGSLGGGLKNIPAPVYIPVVK